MVPPVGRNLCGEEADVGKTFCSVIKGLFCVGLKYSCGEEIEENKYYEVIGGQGLIQFAVKSFAFRVVHFKQKNLISLQKGLFSKRK